MGNATSAATAALSTAFAAMELFRFVGPHAVPAGTFTTSTPTSTLNLNGAVQIPLLLALFGGVAFVHRRLHRAAAAAAGAGTELAGLVVCTAVSLLEYVFFVQPAGVVGEFARALGVAAADALPASATVTFYLSITLVIAHIRAGGEGGGGNGAVVAGHGRVPSSVHLLKKLTIGAAAALLIQMGIALFFK